MVCNYLDTLVWDNSFFKNLPFKIVIVIDKMDQHLGDKILEKYMNGRSKQDIIHTLKISENTFNYWEKINKNELARVDEYLEKQRLKQVLKIQQSVIIPTTDSDDTSSSADEEDEEAVKVEEVEEEEKKPVYHYDHHKFLYKEPIVKKVVEDEDVVKMTSVFRRQQIQEKINKLNDLYARNVIGKAEYTKAASILDRQLSL